MVSADVINRLRHHAGLITHRDEEMPSVAQATWAPDDPRVLRLALEDLVAGMVRLNFELNGPVPSESETAAQSVPREVAYAVAEITRMLRVCRPVLEATHDAAWTVETAWRAILAGDIDDLARHVEDERILRE